MMKAFVAALVLGAGASPVLAADTQPYSPSVTLFAYEKNVDNFCPAGTEPIRYNGVICCGVPTARGYGDAPILRRTAMAANTTDPKSPNYQPEVISMSDN